jgi:hypothetical protein
VGGEDCVNNWIIPDDSLVYKRRGRCLYTPRRGTERKNIFLLYNKMRKYRIDGDNEPKSALLTKFFFFFFFFIRVSDSHPPPLVWEKNGQQMRIEPMLNALSRPQPSISSSLFLDIINSVTELISKQNADGSCLALLFNSHKRPFFQLKTTSYKKIIIVHVESESQQPPKRYVYLSIYPHHFSILIVKI